MTKHTPGGVMRIQTNKGNIVLTFKRTEGLKILSLIKCWMESGFINSKDGDL